MLDSFRDTFRLPDLKRRILFTLAALFVYRLGATCPLPEWMQQPSEGCLIRDPFLDSLIFLLAEHSAVSVYSRWVLRPTSTPAS